MLQSKSLCFDSLWLLLACSFMPPDRTLGPYIVGAALTNALRSWSDAPWTIWADRLVATTLFARMAHRSDTESQQLAMVVTAVAFVALLFRRGDRVLHHMFHYAGFVALLLISRKGLRWVVLDTAVYWSGILLRSSATAAAVAVLLHAVTGGVL